jgi:hypothetical protein
MTSLRVPKRVFLQNRRGSTIVEVIIAAALILGVLLVSGMVLSVASRALANSRTRDVASAVGVAALEQSALFNCSKAISPDSNETIQIADSCSQAIYNPAICSQDPPTASACMAAATTLSSSAGDYIYKTKINNIDYIVEVTSSWRFVPTAIPLSSGTTGDTCNLSFPLGQPQILERIARVSYTSPRGEFVSNVYSSSESFSRSKTFVNIDSSNIFKKLIVTDVPAGAWMRLLSDAQLSQPILHATNCSNNSGEILFPYLADPAPFTFSIMCAIIGYGAPVDFAEAQSRLDAFNVFVTAPSSGTPIIFDSAITISSGAPICS